MYMYIVIILIHTQIRPHQGFGFENGRRVINRSPWVGKGSCRRVKNHSSVSIPGELFRLS